MSEQNVMYLVGAVLAVSVVVVAVLSVYQFWYEDKALNYALNIKPWTQHELYSHNDDPYCLSGQCGQSQPQPHWSPPPQPAPYYEHDGRADGQYGQLQQPLYQPPPPPPPPVYEQQSSSNSPVTVEQLLDLAKTMQDPKNVAALLPHQSSHP